MDSVSIASQIHTDCWMEDAYKKFKTALSIIVREVVKNAQTDFSYKTIDVLNDSFIK